MIENVPLMVLFASVFGDWFDRWKAKHTEHIDWHLYATERRWGWMTYDKTGDTVFYVKLPSYAWEEDISRLEMCWHQRVLTWRSWAGWSVDLHPVRL